MKCPKCNEEALFVNGKYVCVDCGIEITPEEQASQFNSNDLLDANLNVSGSNPITDPDPQVSRAFNALANDNQNQPLAAPDTTAATTISSVDEPTVPEPAPTPISEQADVIMNLLFQSRSKHQSQSRLLLNQRLFSRNLL